MKHFGLTKRISQYVAAGEMIHVMGSSFRLLAVIPANISSSTVLRYAPLKCCFSTNEDQEQYVTELVMNHVINIGNAFEKGYFDRIQFYANTETKFDNSFLVVFEVSCNNLMPVLEEHLLMTRWALSTADPVIPTTGSYMLNKDFFITRIIFNIGYALTTGDSTMRLESNDSLNTQMIRQWHFTTALAVLLGDIEYELIVQLPARITGLNYHLLEMGGTGSLNHVYNCRIYGY